MIYKSDCEQLLKEMYGAVGWVRGGSLAYGERQVFLAACSERFDMNGLSEGALWTRLKKAHIVAPAYTHIEQKLPSKPTPQIREFNEGGAPVPEDPNIVLEIHRSDLPLVPESGVTPMPPTNSKTTTIAIELSLARIELLLKSLVEIWTKD